MSFDFSFPMEKFGNPADIRAQRERTAVETMRVVGYDEAKRILEGIVSPARDPWEELFFENLEKCRDSAILTGKIEADVGFLIGAAVGKGIWFWRSATGVAKGVIPEDRVAAFLEIAGRKGLVPPAPPRGSR